MQQVQRFADEAVYVLQLNSREAVKYIQRNANCDKEAAESAFKTVVKFTSAKK
jgi:hypothetical protein